MELPDPEEFFKQNTKGSRKPRLERHIEEHPDLKPWLDKILTLRLEGMTEARNRGEVGNNVLALSKVAKMANTAKGTNLTHHDINYYWRLHFEEKLNELTRPVEDDGQGNEGGSGGTGQAFPTPGLEEELARTDTVPETTEALGTWPDMGGDGRRTLSSESS